MTAEKSNWNYDDLMCGKEELWFELNRINRELNKGINQGLELRKKRIQATIDFIEYNTKEMEITDNNGDY